MCGDSLHTLYFSSAPIDKSRKPPQELTASIRREIISEYELMRVNAHFLKRCQKCVNEGGQHFQHLML